MASPKQSYAVLLDANVWAAERLLHSANGNALIHALTLDEASIVLPTIVKREASAVIQKLCEKAEKDVEEARRIFSQFSSRRPTLSAPTKKDTDKNIAGRWHELKGLLEEVPFTLAQAEAALERVFAKTSPSGSNNEQFRDCCIWETAIELAGGGRPIHLITGDAAFYESKEKKSLAQSLQADAKAKAATVVIHNSVSNFLESIGKGVGVEDKSIIDAIVAAAAPFVMERIKYRGKDRMEVDATPSVRLKSYMTKSRKELTISFELRFPLTEFISEGMKTIAERGHLIMTGSCSYGTTDKSIRDMLVRQWEEEFPSRVLQTTFLPEHMFAA